MTAPQKFDYLKPWSNAARYYNNVPTIGWMSNTDDTNRKRAYDYYEGLYWSEPDATPLRTVETEADTPGVFLSAASRMVETVLRFLAVKWEISIEGARAEEARAQLDAFSARESLVSKIKQYHRMGLIRGDALLYLTADPEKDPGSRISVHELNAGNYFPIVDPDDPEDVIGCHIAELRTSVDEKGDPEVYVFRQTYRKDPETDLILSSSGLYEQDGWDDRDPKIEIKLVREIDPEEALPEEIDQLPVYHWRHSYTYPWGSSFLRGMETICNAVNQSLTDEDLSLVLNGLGVYATDAGPPVNEENEQGTWTFSPGQMLDVPEGRKVYRVTGVNTVAPYLDHMGFMLDRTDSTVGISAAVAGKPDVSVAESGVALLLQMMPLLAANQEREWSLLDIENQFLFDLTRKWMPAYEGQTAAADCTVTAKVGAAMPLNTDAEAERAMTFYAEGVVTLRWLHDRLRQLGFEIPAGEDVRVAEETLRKQQAFFDADRANSEANEDDDGDTE